MWVNGFDILGHNGFFIYHLSNQTKFLLSRDLEGKREGQALERYCNYI